MTDEEIIHNVLENNLHTEKEGYLLVAKAIRADERAKVLKEVREWLNKQDRATYFSQFRHLLPCHFPYHGFDCLTGVISTVLLYLG